MDSRAPVSTGEPAHKISFRQSRQPGYITLKSGSDIRLISVEGLTRRTSTRLSTIFLPLCPDYLLGRQSLLFAGPDLASEAPTHRPIPAAQAHDDTPSHKPCKTPLAIAQSTRRDPDVAGPQILEPCVSARKAVACCRDSHMSRLSRS
jgi:hypothetical protein